MMESLVTISIPIYNAEKYLDYAICSCINQTYTNWELLLMCDGSTDNSLQIAESYAAKDARITVVNDGTNKGLVYRLNQSVQMAKGKYYARMDADDIMCVDRIAEEVNFLEHNQNVNVVGCSTMLIDSQNHIIGSANKENGDFFAHPSVMGRLEWFKNNPYDEAFIRMEDSDLWRRTALPFVNISKPLLFYRVDENNTIRKMLLSYKTKRKMARYYKRYNKNVIWGIMVYCESLIKAMISIVADCFGMYESILKKRKYREVLKDDLLTDKELYLAISKQIPL